MESVMYRQGDVLFTKIEKAPEGLTQRKTQTIVEGESTGHHHSLVDGQILEDARGYLFLEVLRATQVVHQEHNPITLEPGFYEVRRQREYVAPDIDRMVLD